jgi:hypothetical protein
MFIGVERGHAEDLGARYGIVYAGHLIYRDAVGAEGLWLLLDRRDRLFFRGLSFESGLGATLNFKAFEVPLIFRLEAVGVGHFGLDLTEGTNLVIYHSPAFGSTACAALHATFGRLRVQLEGCMLTSTLDHSALGGGVFYAL